MIESIAFFTYPVADIVRSRRFYEEILELKVDTNFRDEWIEYGIGGQTFAIASMDTGHIPGAKGGVIAFEVDDLESTVARLKSKGVTVVMDITASPVCRFAVIHDPDGNSIIIHKRNG